MADRLKLLVISIGLGVIVALIMIFAKDTALGVFLREKYKAVIMVMAIVIVAAWEIPKYLQK